MSNDDTELEAHDDIALSRSAGLPAYMGKATASVKTAVPDCVKEDLIRKCREVGMTESELLRHWLMEGLYGFETVARMNRRRLELASGIVPEKGSNP